MADTTIAKDIEKYIQKKLSKEYHQTFSEKKIKIGKKKNGNPAVYKFDAVSENEKIIAGIKSHSGRTGGGNFPRSKAGMTYAEIYFLTLAKANKKLLILTSKEFYDLFIKNSDGKIPKNIEIRYIKPSTKLQKIWKKSIDAGRKEQKI